MISKQFFHTLQAKVREVELETDAELVTVLAPATVFWVCRCKFLLF